MRRRASPAGALLALFVASCASSFDSGSTLKGLRILGIQKDKPYAHPGETVHLKMLFDDPRSQFNHVDGADAGHKSISVQWLAGCVNPQADSFIGCAERFSQLKELPPSETNTVDFALTLPGDDGKHGIISDHQSPPNYRADPFGTEFVFFAICAGDLHLTLDQVPPFRCTSPSGQVLGAADFVFGYTEVFAYRELRNQNPKIAQTDEDAQMPTAPGFQTGMLVDGQYVPVDCIGDACIELEQEEFRIASGQPTLPGPGGVSVDAGDAGPLLEDAGRPRLDGGKSLLDAGRASFDAGRPSSSGGSRADAGGGLLALPAPPNCDPNLATPDTRCFKQCTDSDQNKCDKHSIKLLVTKDSAEPDAVANQLENRTDPNNQLEEQMWINYYTDAGKLEHEVKLLNDATTKWNPNHSADLRAPQKLGAFHVWAVAHDNRGGSQWVRATLSTMNPY